VIGTGIILFDEEEMDFGCERRLKSERCLERDDGRPGFSARVFAGSGETVDIKDLRAIAAIILRPDRFREFEPGVRTCRVSKFPYSILLHFQRARHHDLSGQT
jgi:hypothetical protein